MLFKNYVLVIQILEVAYLLHPKSVFIFVCLLVYLCTIEIHSNPHIATYNLSSYSLKFLLLPIFLLISKIDSSIIVKQKQSIYKKSLNLIFDYQNKKKKCWWVKWPLGPIVGPPIAWCMVYTYIWMVVQKMK